MTQSARQLSIHEEVASSFSAPAFSPPASSRPFTYVNYRTREEVTPSGFIFTGKGGAKNGKADKASDISEPWELVMDLQQVKRRINIEYFRKAPPLVSKYLPLLPIADYGKFVSLSEGGTPLIQSKVIGPSMGVELYFKIEGKNPTGSFKDRGSAIEISVAKELGAEAVVLASTGNMAASCACYAAAADIPCFIFVPEDVPAGKLAQVIAFGGRVVQVKGDYNSAARLAYEVAEELGFYLAGNYCYRPEGQKTAAFEIIDQLYGNVPDMVVVPMGCGTNLAAYEKGFREYGALGIISRQPQMVGAQAAGASAIVQGFEAGAHTVPYLKRAETIASAISIANPLDGQKALDSIESTGGRAVAVTDLEILQAQYALSREEGLFVESSAAATVATLFKMSGLQGKRIVCALTGDGLKDPQALLQAAIRPATIKPEVGSFISLYRGSFFSGKTVSFVSRSEVVFTEAPSSEHLSRYVEDTFQVRYSPVQLEGIGSAIRRFLKRGKAVTFLDLQDIIQAQLEAVSVEKRRVLVVHDFEVSTGKDKKPHATVVAEVEGRSVTAAASGTGPVDAVISALKGVCEPADDFSLCGYRVTVRGDGTDAVVFVELKLVRGDQISSGGGTSPDIIQASIEAFENAYNGFFTAS